ncbi:hypothetical protein SA58113_1055 [Staphylococcus argenteus]|nr:hypothetical protein SA58113_1055 [Staphylococcus argenteus]
MALLNHLKKFCFNKKDTDNRNCISGFLLHVSLFYTS